MSTFANLIEQVKADFPLVIESTFNPQSPPDSVLTILLRLQEDNAMSQTGDAKNALFIIQILLLAWAKENRRMIALDENGSLTSKEPENDGSINDDLYSNLFLKLKKQHLDTEESHTLSGGEQGNVGRLIGYFSALVSSISGSISGSISEVTQKMLTPASYVKEALLPSTSENPPSSKVATLNEKIKAFSDAASEIFLEETQYIDENIESIIENYYSEETFKEEMNETYEKIHDLEIEKLDKKIEATQASINAMKHKIEEQEKPALTDKTPTFFSSPESPKQEEHRKFYENKQQEEESELESLQKYRSLITEDRKLFTDYPPDFYYCDPDESDSEEETLVKDNINENKEISVTEPAPEEKASRQETRLQLLLDLLWQYPSFREAYDAVPSDKRWELLDTVTKGYSANAFGDYFSSDFFVDILAQAQKDIEQLIEWRQRQLLIEKLLPELEHVKEIANITLRRHMEKESISYPSKQHDANTQVIGSAELIHTKEILKNCEAISSTIARYRNVYDPVFKNVPIDNSDVIDLKTLETDLAASTYFAKKFTELKILALKLDFVQKKIEAELEQTKPQKTKERALLEGQLKATKFSKNKVESDLRRIGTLNKLANEMGACIHSVQSNKVKNFLERIHTCGQDNEVFITAKAKTALEEDFADRRTRAEPVNPNLHQVKLG